MVDDTDVIPATKRKAVGPANLDEFVPQRGGQKDCVIASLATAVGSSYEDMAGALGIKLQGRHAELGEEGLRSLDTLGALFRFGWSACAMISSEAIGGEVTVPPHLTSDEIKWLIQGRRAIIGYHDAENGRHSVAWDGQKAIDCSDGMIVDLADVTIHGAVALTKLDALK